MIDFVKRDISRLYPKLAAPEQQKLQQHLDSLRDLEKQFDAADHGRRAGCMPCRARRTRASSRTLKQYNRRRAVLRRDHERVHRHPRAGVRVRHHPLRDALHGRPVVQREPAGTARRQPRRRRAHLQRLATSARTATRSGPAIPPARRCSPSSIATRYGKIALLMQKLDAAGVARQRPHLRQQRHGQPGPAQHAQRSHPAGRGRERQLPDGPSTEDGRRLPQRQPLVFADGRDFTATANNKLLVSIAQAFGQTDVTSFGTQTNPAWTTGTLSSLT